MFSAAPIVYALDRHDRLWHLLKSLVSLCGGWSKKKRPGIAGAPLVDPIWI
jgi:hypothetical protein